MTAYCFMRMSAEVAITGLMFLDDEIAIDLAIGLMAIGAETWA